MKARPKVIRLVLGTALGELEVDIAASEAAVDLGVSVQAVVDATTLLLVKDDLEELAAVLLGAETLADNLNGVGEVGQDGVVDSGESAGAGTLLLLGVARAGRALGAGQNATRGEDQDVAVGELLLELTGEAAHISLMSKFGGVGFCLPLLDAVEALQGRDGDKDDNSLLAVANLDLIRPSSQHASSRTSLGPLPVLFTKCQLYSERANAVSTTIKIRSGRSTGSRARLWEQDVGN
jgi:hypothetical protein